MRYDVEALTDGRILRPLLERHGFRFSKSKGQNFLTNPDTLRSIAAASGADAGCAVLEIGPGAGALTLALAERAGRVIAVELDRTLLPVLAETTAEYPNIEIVPGDALRLDLPALMAENCPGLTPLVCANLPYNITSPVLETLAAASCFRSVTVLLQKEVAERLAAPEGSADGGAFTLFLRCHMTAEVLFHVPRGQFHPVPKVDSALLRCVRRERPPVETDDPERLFRVIRGAFLLRRKTLLNSLDAALPAYSREELRRAILAAGLPEGVRGERLTLENFAALCRELDRSGSA